MRKSRRKSKRAPSGEPRKMCTKQDSIDSTIGMPTSRLSQPSYIIQQIFRCSSQVIHMKQNAIDTRNSSSLQMSNRYFTALDIEHPKQRRQRWRQQQQQQSTANQNQHTQPQLKCNLNQNYASIARASTETGPRRAFCKRKTTKSLPGPLRVALLFIIVPIITSTTILSAVDAQNFDTANTASLSSDSNQPPSDSQAESETNQQSATAATSAACFGGLQTFEKISMSSFENPASNSASGSFGSGILIQQDDQALTSECINLCRSQANCLSFVIDYNKFECKSYATTQQELQQEFDAKFQAARSVDNNNNSSTNNTNGYGGQETSGGSASTVNLQQLLPSTSSNYFEKICLDGVANRNQFSDVCGQGRLWTIERAVDLFLDGFVEKEVTNVNSKDECSKLCIFETQFVCRSADYDQQSRFCRLSKEDRRTQPQAMRFVPGSSRQYLENQCATPGPSSCVYETKKNLGIISMDALKFAQTTQDCQMKCNQETTFNCRSYSFNQQRCFLSGDDSVSLNSHLIKLPVKQGWLFGEKKCHVELCTKGIFSYEKITGYTLRSALSTPIDLMMSSGSSLVMTVLGNNMDDLERLQNETNQTRLRQLLPTLNHDDNPTRDQPNYSDKSNIVSTMMMLAANNGDQYDPRSTNLDPLHASAASLASRSLSGNSGGGGGSNLAITDHCRHSCDLGYLNCPAFTIDYKNNRCQRLDRNSQGRHHELVARDGYSYYEKICLRVPEIMSMCQDKYWIFERVIGYELAPRLYDKSLKFVQSRRDCEEYCLEEKQFQCRSALYNDETSDCKLSRYDRRLAQQEGGYYRNFNVRISYLENQCVRDHNIDKKCYYEQARDEPSYPTYTERIVAVQPAPQPSPANRIINNNNNSSNTATSNTSQQQQRFGSSYCEQLCNDNSKFECHSFGYYASTAQCFLSGDDSISAGELAASPSTGFSYYEKKCQLSSSTQMGAGGNITTGTTDDTVDPIRGGITAPPRDSNPYLQPSRNPFPQNTQPPPPTTTTTTTTTTATTPMSDLTSTTSYGSYTPFISNSSFNIHIDQQQQQPQSRPPSSLSESLNKSTTDNADHYKCGVAHTFVYQRISGFEPIGGYLTLLIKNNDRPGIVAECAEMCKRAFECRAFIVDYASNQCFAMLENSSVGLLSLRQTLGKDYFEGFCVANHLLLTGSSCRNKTWVMDKIVDQAVVGVQHQKLITDSDRIQCRQACLEERLFWCKSAMFDGTTGDCKLYSIDRESVPQMRLLFTKGVDFFENQCQIQSSSCPYDPIERDMTIIMSTKSVQSRSTFDCELSCNLEIEFNCRSYTYMDQYPGLPNLCILSSDSRSTSQRGSVKEHARTLYAERNCYYRRPRYPGISAANGGSSSSSAGENLGGGGGGGDQLHQPVYYPPATMGPPVNQLDPYRAHSPGRSGHGLASNMPPTENRYGPPPLPSPPPPPRLSDDNGGGPSVVIGNEVVDSLLSPTLGQGCEPHQYTFERTFGYDFKLAPKERAPIAPTIGIAISCQQECLKRGDRCQSFVVDYALPYQSCFLIEAQVGANKKLLVRAPNSAYFEKVCLPRTGVELDPTISPRPTTSTALTHSPMMSYQHHHDVLHTPLDPQSMDISPSYSNEPWSPQLPYHLQQQQLVQNYPSRSCPKLWSFERFVNHNFTATSDRVVENSLTRAQCEAYCLNEASFSCRSATYDYNSKICRLFRHTRRTIMSQLIDLEAPIAASGTQQSATAAAALTNPSHPGTAHIILTETDSIQSSSSSSSSGIVVSAPSNVVVTGDATSRRQAGARQLVAQAPPPPSTAEPSDSSKNIDYMENTCTPDPSSCQYRQLYDQFSPYIDKVAHAVSLNDCQRQCDHERLFSCKSVNYDPLTRNCMLVNEDLISLNRGQAASLLPKKNTIYSEKGNCEMISVQCNSQEMLVFVNFDSPFRGRIMAKGNPDQCFLVGDGQTSVQFPIVFGPKCNSRQEGHNTFVNEVVIQQHPVIMTDSDKTVRVMCAFEAPEQTITLKSPSSRDNKTGIDVGVAPEVGRTRHDKQHFNSIVSNKAAPPSVVLRILDQNGRDASMINLGDELVLKIQMPMDGNQNSALGIFARNLAAKSSNGELLLLIDNDGCPVDHNVFPALEIDPKDGKSLYSTFKAFRFPSSGLVNFEVQIKFCPERCQPIDCHRGHKMRSYGKRRKRRDTYGGRTSIIQSVSTPYHQQEPSMVGGTALDAKSGTVMPGKSFEYVRKLLLAPPSGESNEITTPTPTLTTASSGATVPVDGQQETRESSTQISSGGGSGALASEVQPDLLQGQEFAANNGNVANNPASNQHDGYQATEMAPTAQNGDKHQLVEEKSIQLEQNLMINAASGGGNGVKQQQIALKDYYSSNKHPILMHVDEKVLPSSSGLSPPQHIHGSQKQPHQQLGSLAPYNRFPVHGEMDQTPSSDRPQVRPTTQEEPQYANGQSNQNQPGEMMPTEYAGATANNNAEKSTVMEAAQNQDHQLDANQPSSIGSASSASSDGGEGDGNFVATPAQQSGAVASQADASATAQSLSNSPAVNQQIPLTENSINNKDMPLRFSILVGENQAPTNGWAPVDQASVLVMNSSSVDLDHIVIPGKEGQSSDDKVGSPQDQFATPIGTTAPRFANHHNNRHQHYQQSSFTSKRNVTADEVAQEGQDPSGSSSATNSIRDLAPDLIGSTTTTSRHVHSDPILETAAASHDCQVQESGKSRLKTIIWAGSIVIALNVSLVILSLVLYFKKVHLRQNHSIVGSSSLSDCGTAMSSEGRWPSVLLKSKSQLGTSLNTHEQFFCKLNSKTGRQMSHEQEFNWPNLSASSSHSTISSMASPVPASSRQHLHHHHHHHNHPQIKRTALKTSPFDCHSSLKSSNFDTLTPNHKTILDVNSYDRDQHQQQQQQQQQHSDKFNARFTSNIDDLDSDRF